ncbi:b(0,+)-type amino acid transporter 1-like [Physella acuta]|uniref:b(0,+)-type amino acid transporter 1-like n=1 Tax=Physella acuta TaxID=109671 RepID=UPI0027DB548E|nr:b(0,+)-type amino acid transporter 1-like [Physella acuta]
MIGKSGGSYTYLRMGLGNPLAFVYALNIICALTPASLVVMLLTFSKYLVALLPTCDSPEYLEKLIAAVALVLLILVNGYSTRLASHVTVLTTVCKVATLLIIIVGGVVVMCQGTTSELHTAFDDTSTDPSSLAMALYSALWATSGGETLNMLVEEVKKPSRNVPLAAILGILVVIVVYTLTNVSYLAVMTKDEMLNAQAVAVVFGDRVLGPAAIIIPLAVMLATLGSANNVILGGNRLIYTAARDKNFPEFFSYIQIHQLTPLSAMTLTAALALIYLAPSDVGSLINYLGFLVSFFNACVYLAMLRFRLHTMKNVRGTVRVPLVIPILMLLTNLYLFISPLAINPKLEYVYVAAGGLGVGAALYIPFIHLRLSFPFYDQLARYGQLLFCRRKSSTEVGVEKVELKRQMGLVVASSIVVGSIIGSGIFISPKGVLAASGSVGLCLLVWVVAGVIALGSALCYAELGSTIGKSGGGYTYLRMGLGNPLAFVYALNIICVVTPASLVVMLLTFSKYLVTLFPTCDSPEYLEKLIAAVALVMLIAVNGYSTKLASHVTVLTTVCKVATLLIIIVGGVVVMCQGTTSELDTGFSGTSNEPTSLAMALYSALWATSGGENLNMLVEEVKNPSRNIPRAAILGILVVIVVYTLTNVSYLAVMTKDEMLNAQAVAVVFGDRVLGPAAIIIPLAVIVACLGSSNNSIFNGNRLIYAAARDKNFPEFFSYIQIHQLTPLSAMTLTAVLALIFLAPSDVGSLINYLGFLFAFFESCVFLAMLRFRLQTMKHVRGTVRVPLVIPILMLLTNLYLFISPLAINPKLEYVYLAAGGLGVGAALYIPFVHFRLTFPFYDRLVTYGQLLLRVCPPPKFIE